MPQHFVKQNLNAELGWPSYVVVVLSHQEANSEIALIDATAPKDANCRSLETADLHDIAAITATVGRFRNAMTRRRKWHHAHLQHTDKLSQSTDMNRQRFQGRT